MFENGEIVNYVKENDVKVTTYPMEKDRHYKIL